MYHKTTFWYFNWIYNNIYQFNHENNKIYNKGLMYYFYHKHFKVKYLSVV